MCRNTGHVIFVLDRLAGNHIAKKLFPQGCPVVSFTRSVRREHRCVGRSRLEEVQEDFSSCVLRGALIRFHANVHRVDQISSEITDWYGTRRPRLCSTSSKIRGKEKMRLLLIIALTSLFRCVSYLTYRYTRVADHEPRSRYKS